MRILIVVQRYGEEVIGGSEGHARTVAKRLARHHTVEIATTTALDYWTWAPHYAPGLTSLDGLPVRRFAVESGRRADFKAFETLVNAPGHTLADELAWPTVQGPHVPELYEFLARDGTDYDTIIFYTYIYAPTVLGLPLVPDRAVLISTAHDEEPLALAPYRALFHLPRAIGYLTPEERDLVQGRFRNENVPSLVLGIGLDAVAPGDGAAYRSEHGIAGPLIAYLGQVTAGKGCDTLLTEWAAYRESAGSGTLVLAGTVGMDVAPSDDVRVLGRVTEAEKAGLLAAADVLVLPSQFESLGIVLLEAWQAGTPALVPAWNAVTAGQVRRSGGGRTYATHDAFGLELRALLAEATARGAAGKHWVTAECAWDAFDERLDALLDLARG